MERKSNKDIMRLFPEPYQSQWFEGCHSWQDFVPFVDNAIRRTGGFSSYPQGGEYWHSIADMIRNHERGDYYNGCNNRLL